MGSFDETWNPVTGCTPISAGCDHCYARTIAERLQAIGAPKYRDGFAVRLHPDTLAKPYRWKSPRRVFVNSMSDIFHARVPLDFVARIWAIMAECPRHTFMVLTKRPERMARWTADHPAPPNVWLGTSVEDGRVAHRVDRLREARCRLRYLSCEPLIGPLSGLDLAGIDWVRAGGETGPGCRRLHPDWVRALRDQCVAQGVPFAFDGWGGWPAKRDDRRLDGVVWAQRPNPAERPLPLFDASPPAGDDAPG